MFGRRNGHRDRRGTTPLYLLPPVSTPVVFDPSLRRAAEIVEIRHALRKGQGTKPARPWLVARAGREQETTYRQLQELRTSPSKARHRIGQSSRRR